MSYEIGIDFVWEYGGVEVTENLTSEARNENIWENDVGQILWLFGRTCDESFLSHYQVAFVS